MTICKLCITNTILIALELSRKGGVQMFGKYSNKNQIDKDNKARIEEAKNNIDLRFWDIGIDEANEIVYSPKVLRTRNDSVKFSLKEIKGYWGKGPSEERVEYKMKGRPYKLVSQLKLDDYESFISNESRYENKEVNPYYVVEALIRSKELQLYPPLWVLDYITDKFAECKSKTLYGNLEGDELNKVFGFTVSGSGRDNEFKKVYYESKRYKIVSAIYYMEKYLGVKVIGACELLYDWLNVNDSDVLKKESLDLIDAGTLRDYYYKYRNSFIEKGLLKELNAKEVKELALKFHKHGKFKKKKYKFWSFL